MSKIIVSLISSILATSGALADTQIVGRFSFKYDRIRPNPQSGIVITQTVNATLSNAQNVSETRTRQSGRAADEKKSATVLGAQSKGFQWEVLGENKLRRTVSAPQSIQVLTITVTGNTCTLETVYSLKPGFSEYQFKRITDGTVAYFTQPVIQSTSCSIK